MFTEEQILGLFLFCYLRCYTDIKDRANLDLSLSHVVLVMCLNVSWVYEHCQNPPPPHSPTSTKSALCVSPGQTATVKPMDKCQCYRLIYCQNAHT